MDELLTVYRSFQTHELVGCQIKSVRFILKNLGNFGIRVKDGNVDFRCIFFAYAMASKTFPPSEIFEEIRRVSEQNRTHVRVPDLVPA